MDSSRDLQSLHAALTAKLLSMTGSATPALSTTPSTIPKRLWIASASSKKETESASTLTTGPLTAVKECIRIGCTHRERTYGFTWNLMVKSCSVQAWSSKWTRTFARSGQLHALMISEVWRKCTTEVLVLRTCKISTSSSIHRCRKKPCVTEFLKMSLKTWKNRWMSMRGDRHLNRLTGVATWTILRKTE